MHVVCAVLMTTQQLSNYTITHNKYTLYTNQPTTNNQPHDISLMDLRQMKEY